MKNMDERVQYYYYPEFKSLPGAPFASSNGQTFSSFIAWWGLADSFIAWMPGGAWLNQQ